MKVYIVTSGSYSDYRIEAIFTNKSDAKALSTIISDGNEVEEWEVNKQRITPIWSIWMKRNGDLDDDFISPHASVGNKEYITYYDNSIHFEIAADTLERAIKVANERRVMIISQNLWGDDKKINELFRRSDKERGNRT